MMPDKLLTLKELAEYINIPEKDVGRLVDTGVIPAYKIGGSFIRFRKEQIDAIRDEITARSGDVLSAVDRPVFAKRVRPRDQEEREPLKDTLWDSVSDFFYFNDFYIVSALIISLLLYVIVKI
jgi:excisionase family DNA binding protein